MKLLNLSKEDRRTEKISPKLLERVREEIEGLAHGSVEIMIKSGYVIGFKFHQWRPFRSKSEGLEQEE